MHNMPQSEYNKMNKIILEVHKNRINVLYHYNVLPVA